MKEQKAKAIMEGLRVRKDLFENIIKNVKKEMNVPDNVRISVDALRKRIMRKKEIVLFSEKKWIIVSIGTNQTNDCSYHHSNGSDKAMPYAIQRNRTCQRSYKGYQV